MAFDPVGKLVSRFYFSQKYPAPERPSILDFSDLSSTAASANFKNAKILDTEVFHLRDENCNLRKTIDFMAKNRFDEAADTLAANQDKKIVHLQNVIVGLQCEIVGLQCEVAGRPPIGVV